VDWVAIVERHVPVRDPVSETGGRPESSEGEAMFQLEILGAKILDMSLLEEVGMYEKGTGGNVAIYTLVCRTTVGSVPIHTPSVWVYGAGRASVKASLSRIIVDYNLERMSYDKLVRFWDSYAKQDHYVLEVPLGAEIVAGMLISNVPPDVAPGQAEE
jgi:hypothetical protein